MSLQLSSSFSTIQIWFVWAKNPVSHIHIASYTFSFIICPSILGSSQIMPLFGILLLQLPSTSITTKARSLALLRKRTVSLTQLQKLIHEVRIISYEETSFHFFNKLLACCYNRLVLRKSAKLPTDEGMLGWRKTICTENIINCTVSFPI